jgi:CubicO group peptidase (beta-lactamase class C family)
MNLRRRLPILIVCVNVLAGLPVWAAPPAKQAARAAGLDTAKLGELHQRMERFVADGAIAGAVTVIGRRGQVGSLEAVGYADLESKKPMRADTVFRIASMSKLVTSVAVMMLEDDGKLDVDDPLEKYLPEFRGLKLITKREGDTITLATPPRQPTITDLMTHTSGIPCKAPPGFAEYASKRDRPLSEAVIAFSQQPLERAPGVEWKYCGPAFDTLGRIIEVTSGKSFEGFVAERILKPLGMKDTTYFPGPAQLARLASVYKKNEKPGPGAPPLLRAEKPGPMPIAGAKFASPSGGLFSTAPDYARLLAMLLDGGSAHGRRYLRPETMAKLTTVVIAPKVPGEKVGFSPGLGMGLGVQVVITPTEVSEALQPGSFGHGGAYGTQAWVDPRNDVFYLLMIQRQGFGNGDQSDVRRAFQQLGAQAIVPVRTDPKPGVFTSPGAGLGSRSK